MQLVLDSKGLTLTKKRQSFVVTPEEGKGESKTISPNKVTSIAITQNVMLSADAVRLAVKNQIPILFFDRIGKAEARLWSPYFQSIATLRRQQVRFSESTLATEWVIEIYQAKLENQVKNLRYLRTRRDTQREELDQAIQQLQKQSRQLEKYQEQLVEEVRNGLMGVEGTAARIYFRALSRCLPVTYQFEKRSRRPAEDMFNACLNYFYGMLYTVVEGALFAVGLDPHLGILHVDEYNKPVLAYDLIEVFRPWVDALVIQLCLEEELLSSFFSANQHGVFLNKNGKKVLIPRFNGWLLEEKRFNEQELNARSHIFQLAGMLSRRIRSFGLADDEEIASETVLE